MAGSSPELEEQPQPFNATKLKPAKRKRSRSPSNSTPRRLDSRSDSRRRSHSPSSSRRRSESPPRKQKRPGQRARITDAERDAIRRKTIERERVQEEAERAKGIHNAVKQHYNAVPERGREWRKTDSRIKGLRSFNNWVKSTIVQKFSPNEDHTPGAQERGGMVFAEGPPPKGLLVLDIGCGKGGDLGKWQQAPQPVDLYVGLDPADVSIDQARDRYREMSNRSRGGRGGRGRGGYSNKPQSKLFQGEFFAQDCFGESIGRIPIIKDVGFDDTPGPARYGGFDVVSMMFCMHYAFESEVKARQMLQNVSGSLKKGGRFLGCIPNSDVLSDHVRKFNEAKAAKNAQPKLESEEPEESKVEEDGEIEEGEAEKTAAFGNEVYRVRFPGVTPNDGIFRPPFGWKYNFFLHEAVEEVPEYVVPWEAFRAIAEDYNLEMQYHKTFDEVWKTEKDDEILGALSERMGVRERGGGRLLVTDEEMEAASFYVAFCFYKV